jgi:hypothetical protein
MYGMIHRAIYELLAAHHSDSEWEDLKVVLNISPEGMISTRVYPDAQTIELVDQAAVLLRIAPDEFLRRLGRFWITFAEQGPYRHILDFTGKDLPSFIRGLNLMHQAVVSAMPQANVPSFTLIDDRSETLTVDYRSGREGLEPFVAGLFQGLLDRFGRAGSVAHVGRFGQAARFVIRYCPQAYS